MKKIIFVVILSWTTLVSAQESRGNFGDVGQWCNDRLAVLRQARQQATLQYQYHDFTAAIATLENGFNTAARGIHGYYTGALTSKAILRGLAISKKVKQAVNHRQLYAKSTIHFMISYIDFIERIVSQLDVPYFQNSPCYYCQNQNHLDFERRFVSFAFEQVGIILRTMLTESGGTVFPLGEASAYLVALESSLKFLSQDLSESLFAANYACVISQARYLESQLFSYNRNRSGYPNDVHAVNRSYSDATQIIHSSRCGSYPNYDSRVSSLEIR